MAKTQTLKVKDKTQTLEVKEVTLPGIGVKYVMPLRAGGNVAVIVKSDGARQVYHFLEDEDRPCDVLKFSEDESQQLANLLGRPMVSAPNVEQLELALGGLEIEWVELPKSSAIVGKTLGDVPLRTQTGASVIAVLRGEEAIANPDIATVFRENDTVMVIGSPEQVDAARDLLEGR